MIALDTNVLVRYLVEDDPKQSAAAARAIERATARGEEIFIGQIVLCELVWVLSHAYDFTRVGDRRHPSSAPSRIRPRH